MNKKLASSIAIAAFLLAGCDPTPPMLVNDISEIVGDWKSVRPGLAMRILPDGTVLQELTLTRINKGEFEEFSILFDEGLLDISGLPEYCGEVIGSYEVKILSAGNLVFSVLEDECEHRIDHFQAAGGQNGVDLEWVRVE